MQQFREVSSTRTIYINETHTSDFILNRRFQGRRKGKEKSFCFVVVQFELIFRHPCFHVVCACIEFFGEVGHFTEMSGFLELCVICEKLMVYRVVSYDIGERRSVQDEENGPQY